VRNKSRESFSVEKLMSRSDFKHVYAVILAGGSGTRFWPLSRQKRPKQLLTLLGKETLLEQTVARLRGLIPLERTYVFCSQPIRSAITRLLPQIPRAQIVAEPASRNTAPTLGLAAHEILRRDPAGVMVVLPSDHIITKIAVFRRVLKAACRWATVEGRSVVLGLKPTRPETGYGYVQRGAPEGRAEWQIIYRVEKFTEKPSLPVAKRYVASRRYLWNGGMFIWRASTLLSNLEKYQSRMANGLDKIARAGGAHSPRTLRRLYPRLENISVDYALMEKIPQVYVVPADIGWSDVGSWAVAYDLLPKDTDGNVRPLHGFILDGTGNMIVSEKKSVAAIGVQDLVIVATDDALLVCPRERSQEVGKVVQEIKKRGLASLL
jgi:mannose-1-phosphate guanylyltransferase